MEDKKRYNFGVLIGGVHTCFPKEHIKGIAEAAKELDVNICFFLGTHAKEFFEDVLGGDQENSYDYQFNTIHEYSLMGGIDGLIIEPSKSELLCRHVSLYETLDKYQIPYIFIQGLYTEMQEKPHILMDDAGGGYLVTKHLLDSGRRNIAGFFKADDRQGIERHKGYVKALQEHEIAYDPDKVVWFHTEDRRKKPALMVRNMVRQNSFPDGIVCYNDQIAVQVMEELERQGKKIPEDVAVTGYDNSLYARQGQGITTITHPQEKLGEMAAKLLLEKLGGVPDEESTVERLIRPELIIRGSSVKAGA